jgi:hypothetical protein
MVPPIPDAAQVGIRQEWLARHASNRLQQALDELRGGAVDAEGDGIRAVVDDRGTRRQGLAVANPTRIPATEAEPGRRAGEVFEQAHQDLGFRLAGDRLTGKQVRAAVGQGFQTRSMPVQELPDAESIVERNSDPSVRKAP